MEITINLTQIYEKSRLAFLSPKKLISQVSKDESIKPALAFYSVITLVGVVFAALTYFVIFPILNNIAPQILTEDYMVKTGILEYLPFLAWSYFVGILFSFVFAGALYIWLIIFRSKTTYLKSYKAFTYARTPSYLLGWIPFLNLIAWFWSTYILYLFLRQEIKISKIKAILVIVSGIFAIAAFIFVTYYYLYLPTL